MGSKELSGLRPATLAVHRGVDKDPAYNSVTTPIYPTSTFAFERVGVHKGYDYTRSGNPTRQALADNLAALEGGTHAWATCTGMAAVTSTMMLFSAGDHIVAGHDIYSGTIRLCEAVLSRLNIEVSFVRMNDPAEVRRALRPGTKAVLVETPSNPMLRVVDIAAVADIARAAGALTIVDNTFMSPFFQNPLALGADIVIHSTTKYLNGHSDVVGGAIVVRDAGLAERLAFLVNALGTACSPFDAWLVLRGVKTLACRMPIHERNAAAVAGWLSRQPAVRRVHYPGLKDHPDHDLARRQMRGFGGMVSFELDTARVPVEDFLGRLRLFALAESLGGVESLAEQPWTMSHASISEQRRREAGITPGLVRLSIGIEDPEDLLADLAGGLGAAAEA